MANCRAAQLAADQAITQLFSALDRQPPSSGDSTERLARIREQLESLQQSISGPDDSLQVERLAAHQSEVALLKVGALHCVAAP